jgi:hypothetical protein
VRGLNILAPPPSSHRAYSTLRSGNRILEWFDDLLSAHYPFSRMGDHFIIVLKHKG